MTIQLSAAIVAQWFIASQLLDIPVHDEQVTTYLNVSGPSGLYYKPRGTCVGNANGTKITYVRVYKGGNDMICHILKTLDAPYGQTSTPRALNVTFVRDPLEHFVSGFTEIVHRVPTRPLVYTKDAYTFVQHLQHLKPNASSTAMAFVRDFVARRLNRQTDVTDAHCFPQIAFLQQHLPHRLQFVGTLQPGGFTTSFRAMSTLINYTLNPVSNNRHPKTSATSGNPFRRAMEALMYNELNPYKEAMCRALLIDYVCFNFELPADCASAIGDHHVRCPVRVPPRRD